MYYTEIIKIIESGMKKDPMKVASYSRLLAKKMEDDGEKRGSERILSALKRVGGSQAVMDTLTTLPVDQESRLDIAEIDYAPSIDHIILSKSVQAVLDDFRDTIRSKNKMMSMGLNLRTTLLLYGPPGCGKTSAAKYLASQLNLPLVTARFDTLISSLLGNTAKNIHRIFAYAKKQPCILFLDEFDAIAKARDDAHELGELKTEALKEILLEINPYINVSFENAKVNNDNVKPLFDGFNLVCEAFDNPKAKAMLVSELLSRDSETIIVSGSGMAGYGDANEIKTVKKMFLEY